jgi:serine/threonine-protein kinase
MLNRFKSIFGAGEAGSSLAGRKRVDLAERFELVEKTSQGSMSRVYRAVEKVSGKTVCIKIQLREKNQAAQARTAERPCEGAISFQINSEFVARTHEYGTTRDGDLYLVMEYVDGVSLEEIRLTMKVGLRAKAKILARAAEGFADIHEAGFIHHDINPRNILVNRQNQVKIIDFGLAVPNLPEFHKPGNRTGALPYMAPELIRRESTDERLDIFAFGAVAFELLTDRLPFGTGANSMAMMLNRINSDATDPAEANPRLSESYCQILRKCLARRKEERWPSMRTLAETLKVTPVRREEAANNSDAD